MEYASTKVGLYGTAGTRPGTAPPPRRRSDHAHLRLPSSPAVMLIRRGSNAISRHDSPDRIQLPATRTGFSIGSTRKRPSSIRSTTVQVPRALARPAFQRLEGHVHLRAGSVPRPHPAPTDSPYPLPLSGASFLSRDRRYVGPSPSVFGSPISGSRPHACSYCAAISLYTSSPSDPSPVGPPSFGSSAESVGRIEDWQVIVRPHSVRVCSPPSRRVAPLRPRSAGLTALTPAPRTRVRLLSDEDQSRRPHPGRRPGRRPRAE